MGKPVHAWGTGEYVRNADSDSIVSACCGHRGCHASLHYLLSPPVMAVCFYGDGPCFPLKEERKEQSPVDGMTDRR